MEVGGASSAFRHGSVDPTMRAHTAHTALRRLAIVAAAGTVVLGAAACGGKSDATPVRPEVAIRTFRFDPSPLVVPVGTTVRWTNHDQILHTVTSGTRDHPDGRFDKPLDGQGATVTVRFAQAGTYHYFCSRHPGMDAELQVR